MEERMIRVLKAFSFFNTNVNDIASAMIAYLREEIGDVDDYSVEYEPMTMIILIKKHGDVIATGNITIDEDGNPIGFSQVINLN